MAQSAHCCCAPAASSIPASDSTGPARCSSQDGRIVAVGDEAPSRLCGAPGGRDVAWMHRTARRLGARAGLCGPARASARAGLRGQGDHRERGTGGGARRLHDALLHAQHQSRARLARQRWSTCWTEARGVPARVRPIAAITGRGGQRAERDGGAGRGGRGRLLRRRAAGHEQPHDATGAAVRRATGAATRRALPGQDLVDARRDARGARSRHCLGCRAGRRRARR